jgi:hypothetical protein
MTADRLALVAATTDTLLTYALYVDPDPLVVNAAATLTLVVSNSSRQAITCTSIQVTLPVGTNAKDLIASGAGMQTQVPTGWNAATNNGVITLTPSGDAGKIAGQGISFLIATTTNGETGTATITVSETASSPSQPSAARTATIPVAKFPTQFRLGDLTVTEPENHDVPAGGTATLMWIGQGDGVTYTMDYQPADAGKPVSDPVGSTGPYTSQPLTRSGGVTFTLTASVAVPGQDQPLIAQRQQTVSVETLSLHFEAAPTTVGRNGLVRFEWNAPNAASCRLDPDGVTLPTSGKYYVIVRDSRTYTMNAFPAQGEAIQQQVTITVDPGIVQTEAGFVVTGKQGGKGAQGNPDASDGIGMGGTGGRGEDAVLQQSIPPLDPSSRPARVIPISVSGGKGGTGGDGGMTYMTDPFLSGEQSGPGYGGLGGNAIVNVTLDGSGTPAQYLFMVVPGPGGDTGQTTYLPVPPFPNRGTTYPPDQPGQPGSVTITIDGQVVTPPS